MRAHTDIFQSTHPSWGATIEKEYNNYEQRNFNPRTHRGVRREAITLKTLTFGDFNPRTHRGVRHNTLKIEKTALIFQSTHPSWGATVIADSVQFINTNFNPRTHRGVRHQTHRP